MRHLRYPLPHQINFFERIAIRLCTAGPFFCPVCGRLSISVIPPRPITNLRESAFCCWCRATNRQRQIALIICRSPHARQRSRSLKKMRAASPSWRIYNTEASGPIHNSLKGSENYTCSEYLGNDIKSGEIINGVMHVDLQTTSFADASMDLVISSDVIEHIPEPYRAFAEIHRILSPRGRHVFTVPFYQDRFHDEQRTEVEESGETHHLLPPIYHHDPLREEGALVHRIFSLEMLLRLKEIGFHTYMYQINSPSFGILGPNGIVFESIKL